MKIDMLALAAILVGSIGRAQTAPAASSATLALSQALEAARRDNPELKAARGEWEAAEQAPQQASALEDPTVSLMGMIAPFQSWPSNGQIGVSQSVPFPGVLSLRGRAAGLDAEMARQAYRAKTLSVLAETVDAYYELYFLLRTRAILKEQTSVLERAARVAEKKYAVGREPQARVFRAQVELAGLATDLVTSEQRIASARARLNALLDRPPRSPLGEPLGPPVPASGWDVGSLSAAALASRPELLALRALEGRRGVERSLALRKYFPDFTIGYQYMGPGMSYTGRAAGAGQLGLSLPLWLGKNGAAVREADSRRDASRMSVEDLSNRTRFQVEDLVVKLETEARLSKLYDDTVLPQAQAALESTQSAYESDAAGFLDLLDAERELLRFELEHERHLVDYAEDLAELERIVGGTLPPPGEKK